MLSVGTFFPYGQLLLDDLLLAVQPYEVALLCQFCFKSLKMDQPGHWKVIFVVFGV